MKQILFTTLMTTGVFVAGPAEGDDAVLPEGAESPALPPPKKAVIPKDEPAAPPAPVKARTQALEIRVKKALKRFDSEPTLEELKRAALRYQDADPESARNWRTAPNKAALLPTLKLILDRDVERDESLDRYQDEPDRWGADTDRDLGFQVSLQWRLDELVFNSDEIRVWRALSDRAARRESVLMLLVSYYFERRKHQLELALAPPTDLMALSSLHLKIIELTSTIDALTGGYLSEALEK